jgi:DNA-binding NtrC family response regulator
MSSAWREFRKTGNTQTADKLRKLGLLVVDDEQAIVQSLGDVFADTFDIHKTSSSAEALEIFRQHQPRIVVSDQRMPGMTGIELLRQIKEIQPDTMCILITGYADISVVVTALNEGLVWKYVTKPWDHALLRQIVLDAGREYLKRAGEDQQNYSFLGH